MQAPRPKANWSKGTSPATKVTEKHFVHPDGGTLTLRLKTVIKPLRRLSYAAKLDYKTPVMRLPFLPQADGIYYRYIETADGLELRVFQVYRVEPTGLTRTDNREAGACHVWFRRVLRGGVLGANDLESLYRFAERYSPTKRIARRRLIALLSAEIAQNQAVVREKTRFKRKLERLTS